MAQEHLNKTEAESPVAPVPSLTTGKAVSQAAAKKPDDSKALAVVDSELSF